MNLISVMVAASLSIIVGAVINQMMLNQVKMHTHIEYLNDTQTARNNLEMYADCKQSNINKCEIMTKDNNILLGTTGRSIGRADLMVVCDSGFNVFVRKQKTTTWTPLVPLKVCGNGSKICNLQQNADGVSCTGGSNSYE